MTINNGIMSSNRDDWRTPIDLFRQLDAVFGFDLDVAADDSNHLCKNYMTLEDNALYQPWDDRGIMAFCNPPYGLKIKKWITKCDDSAYDGCSVVALLPARTDTAAWKQHIWPTADAICFMYGRLKFDDCKGNAPFPSALVVWGRGMSNTEINKLSHLGKWVRP